MKLNNLTPAAGSRGREKRIGRGEGSGHGGTSTRGHKGAQARSGYSRKTGFEGGQMPIQRRLPKFGFTNPNRVEYKAINVDVLELIATENNLSVITLDKAVEVTANEFSKSAIAKIEAAGGKANTLK